jgi:hypothetical protein
MATLLSVNNNDDFLKAEPEPSPTHRPQSIAELDVRAVILEDIALKTLYLTGSLSVLELAERMCLSYEVVDALFSQLRAEQFCLVTGMTGHVHQIAITAQGRTRAMELLAHNHYAGPAPVSFERYAEQTRKQSVKKVDVHAADVHRAFANLVIDNETLRKLGTALNSGSSMFLWGPAGTGKTTIAETLSKVLAEDAVWIPYAVETGRAGCALGFVPAAVGPGGRRIDRRDARPAVQLHIEVLCRAGADEGQQRRADH